MVVRSTDCWPGNTAWTCGHMLPLKLFVSTVLRTTGTPNTRAALARATLLLMIAWRSKLATPNSIWGCRSMRVTTQLSGVSSPFSLSFGRFVSWDMTSSFVKLGGSTTRFVPADIMLGGTGGQPGPAVDEDGRADRY